MMYEVLTFQVMMMMMSPSWAAQSETCEANPLLGAQSPQ